MIGFKVKEQETTHLILANEDFIHFFILNKWPYSIPVGNRVTVGKLLISIGYYGHREKLCP